MRKLSELTLEDKIGQMVMCGFHGTEPSDHIMKLIAEQRIGGVIYFSRNIATPEQVHRLSLALQQHAESATGIPLFIGIDQEGGMVARITEGITLAPGNMALGAVDDGGVVSRVAEITGRELGVLGINMNLAPVLDVNNNPRNPVIGVRSFGDHPERVGKFGKAAIEGYQNAGICAAVKHFPGHGDTEVDSHFGLPTIVHDRERMEKIELVPFREAIQADVDVVMTAHVVFPALDSSLKPSTLSSEVISGLLRGQMGYDGVVITDCLEMNAVAEGYGTEEAAVMAIEAGVDIVLVSHRYDRQMAAVQAIKEAVRNGRISEEQINESAARILRLKKVRNLGQPSPDWEQAQKSLELPENKRFVQDISERSITVIKDDPHKLPLDNKQRTYVVSPVIQALNAADETFVQEETVGSFLSQMIDGVYERQIPAGPSEEEIVRVLRESRSFEQVVAVTYNTALFKAQAELIRRLHQEHQENLVVAAIRNPFDFLDFPEVTTQIASYESRPLALQSVAKVLAGQIPARGKLPVRM